MDQIVVEAGPLQIGFFVAAVVVHGNSFRRKNGEIDPAFSHDPQLILVNRRTNFFVAHARRCYVRRLARAFELSHLTGPKSGHLRWRCGEVTVAINDHGM